MANTKLTRIARCTLAIAGAFALVYSGCSMCCGPYDYDYPSFGGAVQRSNPSWGRVGSVYSDPGHFGGPSSDSNLKPHDSGYGYGNDGGGIEAVPEPNDPNELQIQSPNNGLNGSGNRNGSSGVLPEPPQPGPQTRPSPDDETRRSIFQRLRNQSRNSDRKWR